jgi:uncharacterized damage-inducible protein DinB
MNQRYIDYANYNIWANTALIQDFSQHPKELLTQELVGSFPTIRATMLHIWLAETGWLSRLHGNGWEASKVLSFNDSTQDFFEQWRDTSKHFKSFAETCDLEKEVSFDHEGDTFSIPNREIIQTVFNHGSFHRGQIVMMMRQLGITDISQTDYIEWVRENSKSKPI